MHPRLASHLPGCGGTCGPSDRLVEEILAKQPARTGNHWWLKVHKDGLGTAQVRAAIARSVNCDPELVACAGYRDRRTQCIQWFSLPVEVVDHPGPLRRAGAHGKMRVLELTNSHKPVEAATVSGLRWKCRLRGATANDGYLKGKAVLDNLRRTGVPNWFPEELVDEDLARLGRQLLTGKSMPGRAAASHVDRERCRRACQATMFDRWLAARIRDGLLDHCVVGDRLRSRTGDYSTVEDVAHADKRLDSWEATVLGPLFGDGLRPTVGEAAAREDAVLADAGITPEQCAEALTGDLRAARIQPTKTLLDIDGKDLLLHCDLPVDGSIEAVLRELMG
jgi:tRNA(Glu) U13 pseudouridine synthase TruD